MEATGRTVGSGGPARGVPSLIRVLIADDHPFFRDGLRTLLDSVPDLELAGEAATGEEAVSLAAEVQPRTWC